MAGTDLARIVDALPTVADASDRALRFATPDKNQLVFNLTTRSIERYTGSGWEVQLLATTIPAHTYAGATAAAQVIAALQSLNAGGTTNLPGPVTLDLRGLASPIVLDADIIGSSLKLYDKTPITFLWGAQEVRVAATQSLIAHHHHICQGTAFVSKDAAGARVLATTMFRHLDGYGIGGPGNGVVTTKGSAVITKVAPAAAAWAYLEVGSPIMVFGFVSQMGFDNWQLDGAIDASQTTLTFDTTTGMETAGYLRIGDEVIYHTGKTGTTATGCTRGFQGTTAAVHADNAPVYRPVYQPFYVKSISGNDLTLDAPIDFASTNGSVIVGSLDIVLELQGATFDGNYVYNVDDTANPYGIQITGGRHCYIRGGVFHDFDHAAFDLEQCQDCGFDILAIEKVGHYPAQVLGVGAFVFGWNKRMVGRIGTIEQAYDGLAIDDRTTAPSLRDGPCEDSDFYVGVMRNCQQGGIMHGAHASNLFIDRVVDVPATGCAYNVGGTQWITDGKSKDCTVDVRVVSGAAGFAAILQSGVDAHNKLIVRTRGAPSTVDLGNSLDIYEYPLAIAYAATMALDASVARHYLITPTDTSAFTLSSPTNPTPDSVLILEFLNSSGGTMGTPTFGSDFKLGAAFDKPANGKKRVYTFRHNGTAYIEVGRSPADIT